MAAELQVAGPRPEGARATAQGGRLDPNPEEEVEGDARRAPILREVSSHQVEVSSHQAGVSNHQAGVSSRRGDVSSCLGEVSSPRGKVSNLREEDPSHLGVDPNLVTEGLSGPNPSAGAPWGPTPRAAEGPILQAAEGPIHPAAVVPIHLAAEAPILLEAEDPSLPEAGGPTPVVGPCRKGVLLHPGVWGPVAPVWILCRPP